MSLFSRIVKDHGIVLEDAEALRKRAIKYSEFGTGFVMLVPEKDNTFRLITMAVDDKYPASMWRFIRQLLKCRTGPTYMQFTKNYDILYKASQRYGAVELFGGIVLFP